MEMSIDVDVGAAFAVVGIVLCSSLLLEALSWALIWRTSAYRSSAAEVESISKKLQALEGLPAHETAKKKKKLNESMALASNRFNMHAKIKGGFMTMVAMGITYRFMMSSYKGVVAARLPFAPPGIFQRITHGNLPGDDLYDCSALFIYILCGMCVRGNLNKALGQGPTRAAKNATMAKWPTDEKQD